MGTGLQGSQQEESTVTTGWLGIYTSRYQFTSAFYLGLKMAEIPQNKTRLLEQCHQYRVLQLAWLSRTWHILERNWPQFPPGQWASELTWELSFSHKCLPECPKCTLPPTYLQSQWRACHVCYINKWKVCRYVRVSHQWRVRRKSSLSFHRTSADRIQPREAEKMCKGSRLRHWKEGIR